MPHVFSSPPLAFPEHLEPFYQADLADDKIRVSIQTSLLCSLLYAGFGILDFWAIPSAFGPALLVRAAVLLVTLALVLLPRLRRNLFLAWYEEITTVLYLTWGGGIMLIIALAQPGEVSWNGYYAGLILVSMALYTWTYLRPHLAALIGLALAACYILLATWAQRMHVGQMPVLMANCFFLISANAVGLFSRYTRERFSREAYLLRSALRNDLKQEEEAKRRSEHRSEHDPLTGLPNRLRFMRQLDGMLQTARQQDSSAAVLFIDLDGFKPVNDTYGHHAGDVLLREIAQRIRAGIRGSDAVARLGGDEFVVALAGAQIGNAARVAADLAHAISLPVTVDGVSMRVSASVGMALYPADGASAEALLGAADQAMYGVKRAGKPAKTQAGPAARHTATV